jgi:hypothetical protein
MEMIPVQSSNLSAVGYDGNNQILRISFNNGSLYEYTGVPESIYTGLLAASSKGSYFDQYVKKAGYSYSRIA